MIKSLLLIFASLSLFSCQTRNESSSENQLLFQSLFNSEKNPSVACYRIPSLVSTSKGRLIAAIDERVPSCNDLRSNRDINIVIRTSTDYGRNWSDIRTIVDLPDGESASDPSMIYDTFKRKLFLFFNYMDLNNAPNEYYLKVMSSLDGGISWTEPKDITDEITHEDWQLDFKFITSGRGMQTRSGKLVHTLVNLEKGLHLFSSDDHGESWQLIDKAIKPGDESKIIELMDGSWMINSRVNKSGLRFIHRSTDQGLNWTSLPDSTLVDPSCNASIINYESQLLFCNANSLDSRTNLSLRTSNDDGKKWSHAKTIYKMGSAYSSICLLDDGAVGVFFEKDDYKDNVFVRLEKAWMFQETKD